MENAIRIVINVLVILWKVSKLCFLASGVVLVAPVLVVLAVGAPQCVEGFARVALVEFLLGKVTSLGVDQEGTLTVSFR